MRLTFQLRRIRPKLIYRENLKLFVAIIFCLILVGCATRARMNNLSLGMTKPQVLSVMGKPNSTAAMEGVEVLRYDLQDDVFDELPTEYWVTLENGKVTKYGRAGDWEKTDAS